MLVNSNSAQRALGALGKSEDLSENVFNEIEKFICEIYGHNDISSIDAVRLELFLQTYRVNKNNQAVSFAKKMEGTFLPPCQGVFNAES